MNEDRREWRRREFLKQGMVVGAAALASPLLPFLVGESQGREWHAPDRPADHVAAVAQRDGVIDHSRRQVR